ncbi:MAG: TIGR02646 family protein [Bacilli bacterium]|nr:TIGR02646 family protein [Bacilli bacterium]
MKNIDKQSEPFEFEEWKKKNSSCSWEDFRKTKEYGNLKSTLCKEQKGLCCYCEIFIQGNQDTHIEHHKPQSSYPKDKFNFQNLLASCQFKDSCGHKKGGRYFDDIVSPTGDCENRFIYTGNGNIIPSDENDENAYKTIDLLGLDCKRLRDLRYSIFKTLEYCDNLYVADSLRNCKEWFFGFHSVIQYIAKKRGVQ